MRDFCKIIVKKSHFQWSAWFEGLPEFPSEGRWPLDAVRCLLKLVELVEGDVFDITQLVASEETDLDDQLEFLIPLRNFRRIPGPSLN